MDNIRIGVAGLGSRGMSLIRDLFMDLPGMIVTAVCDDYGERAAAAAELIRARTGKRSAELREYGELLTRKDVDAILIITPWETHLPFAMRAMEAGVPCAIEVGGASDINECWELVRTWERTRVPFMFLENCCFGRTELAVTNMAREGVFGEIVHCAGAYAHDLREEIAGGDANHHYRLRHYINRCCENYPSHELGPIAKLLRVNEGNRVISVSSNASKAAGLRAYIGSGEYAQADIVQTFIRCARGETISLSLDTTLPRYYSRDFTVRGTKGMYEERTNSIFLDGVHSEHFKWEIEWGNARTYIDKYEHPIWRKYRQSGLFGGHDGMDALVYGAFLKCLRDGSEMPISVYDAATWMAVTPLSEMSIAAGGASVPMPDFSCGKWLTPGDSMNVYAEKYV